MRILFFIAFISLFIACKQEGANSSNKQLEKTPQSDQVKAKATLDMMIEEMRKNPNDKVGNTDRLKRGAQIATDNQLYSDALGFLQTSALDYTTAEEKPEVLVKMGEIFQNSGKETIAQVMAKALNTKYGSNSSVSAFVKEVNPPSITIDSLISRLSYNMFDDSTYQIKPAEARLYVDACEAYAVVNQGDPQSVEYIHKAAETARNLQTIPKALSLYDWIIERYPSHPRASQSLFLKGFTFDNNLGNFTQAEIYYKEFLEKYPESEFASSAEFLLANLGKSDEELLEALQKKGN